MVKEFKDWLFVEVPEDGLDFEVYNVLEGPMIDFWVGAVGVHEKEIDLPPGSYQIIGKGDQLSMGQWEEIVDRCEMEQVDMDFKPIPNVPIERDYFDYGKIKWYVLNTATESGHSLLKSLGMEPGTTLVLKKI